MNNTTYSQSKNDRAHEAVLYAANTLLELGKKSYAFTASHKYQQKKDAIVRRMVDCLYDRQKKVLFLDYALCNIANDDLPILSQEAFDLVTVRNASPEAVKAFLEQQQQAYDAVIFNLPPVSMAARAVEYAKLCECTLLIERYGHTTYQAYEDSLLSLRQHGVSLGGVITFE